jgi:thioredoxin 1
MTTTLTAENFENTVQKDGIVLIDWWAPWCGPCRSFAPIYDASAKKHPDVVFGKINTEEEPEMGQGFNIQAIPTLMIFRDGILLFAQPGMVPAAALEDLIGKVQALDMDEVRRKIAEQDKEKEEKTEQEEKPTVH